MITGVVVCPAAPMLIPGLADALVAEHSTTLAEVRAAADALARRSARLLVLCRGPQPGWISDVPAELGPSPFGGAAVIGRSAHLPAPCWVARALLPMTTMAVLPVSDGVLRTAGSSSPLSSSLPSSPSSSGQSRARAAAMVADPTAEIGILAMADGAAGHGPNAPRAEDARAGDFDRSLHRVLELGAGPDQLSGWCAENAALGTELGATAPPVLAVLAELTAGQSFTTAEAVDLGFPYGVGYHLASWWP